MAETCANFHCWSESKDYVHFVENSALPEVICGKFVEGRGIDSYLLHPPLLDETGLHAALHWYVEGLVKRSNIQISLSVNPAAFPRLAPEIETTIFRIIEESLTNVYRHSQSENASVEVVKKTDVVVVRVRDYGKGPPKEILRNVHSSGFGSRDRRNARASASVRW